MSQGHGPKPVGEERVHSISTSHHSPTRKKAYAYEGLKAEIWRPNLKLRHEGVPFPIDQLLVRSVFQDQNLPWDGTAQSRLDLHKSVINQKMSTGFPPGSFYGGMFLN